MPSSLNNRFSIGAATRGIDAIAKFAEELVLQERALHQGIEADEEAAGIMVDAGIASAAQMAQESKP